ncbi:hypothetical protein [Trinickia fusca]|uniref:hypothetical protein n=1 Tax=Trinickia fusca TaxID=2419777 RepID=UPI001FE59595|nr:hypothetical protein [Trinickia fusca]
MAQIVRRAAARCGDAFFKKTARYLCTSLVAVSALLPTASFSQTQLNSTTSWIGNTFGYGDGKWVQLDVEAMAVGPDGSVYTNAPWDESGSEIGKYSNGTKVGLAGNTHGWGNTGGDAIAINGTYLYAAMSIDNESGKLTGSSYPPSGSTWFGITRRLLSNIAQGAPFASGIGNVNNTTKNSFLIVNTAPDTTDAGIRGLAASSTELYVSNAYANQIQVFDANTMAPLRSWAASSPGRIAIDQDGSLWVIQGMQSSARSVVHYSAAGAALPGTVALPPSAVPADLTISPSGQLLIADDGPSQQILIYNEVSGQTQYAGALGAQGGIFQGTAGTPGNWRFNGLTGLGFDSTGNLYVAQNGAGLRAFGSTGVGQGTVLESYNWSTQALNWRLHGLLFVDGAALDPASPGDVFSGSKHFSLNYSASAGQEWSYAGFTMNAYRYPDDPALHTTRNVRGEPLVRRINGQRFLYTQDMYAHYLSIYRFQPSTNGEVAVPSGLLSQNTIPGSWPQGQPKTGEWMWRDANGDGAIEPAEIQSNPSTGNTVCNGYWYVDDAANVWLATEGSGIREMPLQGVDAYGNPVYQYQGAKVFPMPQPFTHIARIVYVSETDTMYISGYTSTQPYASADWKAIGTVLARYNNWSSGSPSLQWTVQLPYVPSSTLPAAVGLAAAGNYVFVAESLTAHVDVYDASTGQQVGFLAPSSTVGSTSGWIDVEMGISAALRSNGEYVVLAEEDARAKVLMYRWTPSGSASAMAAVKAAAQPASVKPAATPAAKTNTTAAPATTASKPQTSVLTTLLSLLK